MQKTPEQLAIQKAIVCLYLRKRQIRREANQLKKIDYWEALERLREKEYEAHNALESMKRVLWHNDWD